MYNVIICSLYTVQCTAYSFVYIDIVNSLCESQSNNTNDVITKNIYIIITVLQYLTGSCAGFLSTLHT